MHWHVALRTFNELWYIKSQPCDTNSNNSCGLKYLQNNVPVTPTSSVPRYAKTAVVKVDHTAKNLPPLPAAPLSACFYIFSCGASLTQDVFMKSPRTLPILKSSCVVIWSSSTHENQTQKNQANDDHHFDGRQPELKLAKEFDAEVVDENDRNKEYGDESSGIDPSARNPVLDNQGRSGQVIRSDNDVLELCQRGFRCRIRHGK